MNPRRQFFKQFIGQMGVLRDDIRGVENIPLNRLNELPDEIIDNIEPIFFHDENWQKVGSSIILLEINENKSKEIKLSKEEDKAFSLFKRNIKIIEVSNSLVSEFNISYEKAREISTSFFFKLASNRICHPRVIYNINELSKLPINEQNSDRS